MLSKQKTAIVYIKYDGVIVINFDRYSKTHQQKHTSIWQVSITWCIIDTFFESIIYHTYTQDVVWEALVC